MASGRPRRLGVAPSRPSEGPASCLTSGATGRGRSWPRVFVCLLFHLNLVYQKSRRGKKPLSLCVIETLLDWPVIGGGVCVFTWTRILPLMKTFQNIIVLEIIQTVYISATFRNTCALSSDESCAFPARWRISGRAVAAASCRDDGSLSCINPRRGVWPIVWREQL